MPQLVAPPRVFHSWWSGRAARPIFMLAVAATTITATLFGCTGRICGTAGTPGSGGSSVLAPGVAGPINPVLVVAHRLSNIEF